MKSDNILSISYRNNRICVNNNIHNIPIMIYSFDGRLVFSSTVLDSIDVPALPKGLYYVKAITNTGFFLTCKIIIKWNYAIYSTSPSSVIQVIEGVLKDKNTMIGISELAKGSYILVLKSGITSKSVKFAK